MTHHSNETNPRTAVSVSIAPASNGAILNHAWNLYTKHFGVIAAVVTTIWLPLDLLSTYLDYHVFDPEDYLTSILFMWFLDAFIGIIATAAVISIGYTAWLGDRTSFGGAMRVGLKAWGRMWCSRFLATLAVLLGLLLFVIPGIYLMIRLALVEPVAVGERKWGMAALRRSFELTEGSYWQLFGFSLCIGIALGGVVYGLYVPLTFVPGLDHWLMEVAAALLSDLVMAFGTLCYLSAFVIFSATQGASKVNPSASLHANGEV